MSDRVVAIKILGLGTTTSVFPAAFTTRAHPLYISVAEGTVVSLTDQLSSEISMFGSMGSDSTTSFTILSTAATRALLMSRGKVPVKDPTNRNQPMRTTGYISPAPGTVTIPVSTPAPFTVGGYYRIQNTVFKVTAKTPTLQADRVWGCANVPIPMTQQGVGGQPVGSVIYDLNGGNPLGGCEQLPVVIETVDLDSVQPEVIFRGYISKVTNDTSSGQTNLIKVDCSSMMAYLKQAPFVPAWGAVTANTTRRAGLIYQTAQNDAVIQTVLTTPWQPELYGARFDPLSPEDGATVVNLWQVREEGKGGINVPLSNYESPGAITLPSEVNLSWGGTATGSSHSFLMCFNSGYYDNGGYAPEINLHIGVGRATEGTISTANRENSRSWYADATVQSATVKGENCVEASDFATLIIDLLLGTYGADLTLSQGARSATESAWLPFPSVNLQDLIDLPSLNTLVNDLDFPDIVKFTPQTDVSLGTEPRVLLPYEHASVKTVSDVLDGILKRLGAYMVCDKGKFYFGSWAGERQTPILVSDNALSDPSIRLTFERGMCLMRVTAKYCTQVYDSAETFEVPYLNVDLASSALGKDMSIGHWQAGHQNPDDGFWGNTRMMANAFGLLMRYSQSAARVDLSLRDSVKDLQVGQEIALTSQYLVNSEGEMGVSVLTGYVLKAARSWKTPTTAYTVILPGYVSVANKIPVWSCSAQVADVPGGDNIQVEANRFTVPPPLAYDEAPDTDAAAFQLTHDLLGSWYDVQLLDQYGTLKYQGALTGVSGNFLELPGFDAYAIPGDIIVLADATTFGAGLDLMWDVFLANNTNQVAGSTNNARKWVP